MSLCGITKTCCDDTHQDANDMVANNDICTTGSLTGIHKLYEMHNTLNESDFKEYINNISSQHSNRRVFVLFNGEKIDGGKSWCPDCIRAEPIIFSTLDRHGEGCVLVIFYVNRLEYLDPDYIFRKNADIKLNSVPTLQR
jgi:thiol-disulfide isomerase/thioredoxin